MKKYKLLKPLPDIEVGTIIEYKDDKYFFENWLEVHAEFNDIFYRIFHRDSKDWYEEVKEPKTIYDLKFWDYYWTLSNRNNISRDFCWKLQEFFETDKFCTFITEREAKRNKLLRELATRTDKWLPDEREFYTTYNDYMNTCKVHWNWKACDMIQYHMWLVFKDEQEYNKYMTEEANDLLFNI